MDWSKAKNILIVTFIITNIFLLYNINEDIKANKYFYEISDERLKDIVGILNDKGIEVEGEIPRDTPTLPIVTVEYETYDEDKIASDFLDSYTKISDKYISGNEMLQISHNKKLLTYKRDLVSIGFNEINSDKAKEIADKFIGNHGFDGDDVTHWRTIRNVNGDYEVIYKQTYGDLFIADSEVDNNEVANVGMEVKVNSSGVIEFTRKWFDSQVRKVNSKRVIPVTKALLMSIDDIKEKSGEENAVITDISIGYILDVAKFNNFVEWHDIDMGDASPYWRICLKNKECIYKQAYE